MPKRDPKKGRPAMAIQEEPLISPAMKTKMQREAGERQVKLYLKASQGEPGAEAEFRKVYGIPSRQYPHKYVPKTQSGNVLKDLPPELIKSTTGQRVKSEIDFPRTDMRNKNFVNPLTTYLAPHITNPELKKAMDKIQLAPIEMALPIPGLQAMGKIPSALKIGKNLTKGLIPPPAGKVVSKVDDIRNMFRGQLTDKEKEMYKWFENQQKFNKLPKTTNKESLGVLEDFKTRIQTPEGKKRMKELGIDNDNMLQKIDIVEDPNTFGYFTGDRNKIVVNPNHPLPKKVVRHEIEHGIQNAKRAGDINKAGGSNFIQDPKILKANTEIDNLLSGLELRREGTPNKDWLGSHIADSPVNINDYNPAILNKQNATDYFLTGSEGREKSAFLGEVQQYMMDTGIIPKQGYAEITPEMVKETMINAMFDEQSGGKFLRLFNIMKPVDSNYKLISKGLNKMLGLIPPAVIGTGAAKRALNKDDFATGGMIPKRNRKYQDGGEKGEKPLYDSLDHKQSYYLHDDITRLFNDWNYYKKFQEAGWPIELVSEAIKRNQDKWQRFDKDPMRFEENMIGHRMDKFVPDSLSKFVENKDLESLLRYGHSVVQESKPTDMRQKIEGMKSGGMKKAKGKYMKGGKKGYYTGGATAEQIADLLAKQSEEQKQATRLSGITDAATMGADMIAGQLAQSAQADLADLDYRVDPEASMRKANRKNIAGSMLSTTAKGAAAGTKIGGPGIGTLIGAGAGLVFSGASALFGKGQRDKEIKEAKNQRAGVLSNLYAGAMESQSFKKGGKKGGKVKGQGGPKEDNIEMKVPDGSFIVPAENAEEAMEIGMAYLDWNEETIAERNMGGSKINISNGEVVFAPEEVEMLKMYGVDLDALAPNAPPERQMEQEPGMEQMPGMGEVEQEIPAFEDGGGKNSLTKQEKREEREARKKSMAENNMLTTGQKLARFAPEIVGALQSSAGLVGLATAKKMPDPVVSLELKKILSETAKLKEQGLDPRTKNIALQEIEKNRRSAMNAIITRGGTTSDIMSGMRDITSGTLSSVEKIIDADEAIRKGNRTAYLDALMKIGTRKDAIQDQKAQRIKDRSDAYGDLFSAGLENIAGSRRFRGLKDIYKEESDKPGFTFPG